MAGVKNRHWWTT